MVPKRYTASTVEELDERQVEPIAVVALYDFHKLRFETWFEKAGAEADGGSLAHTVFLGMYVCIRITAWAANLRL